MKAAIKQKFYELAIKVIAKTLQESETKLQPIHLSERGWIKEYDAVRQKEYYVESNIKDRDKVSIEFENHYYRVWHGKDRTFIALETSIEWLQLYLLLCKKRSFDESADIIGERIYQNKP